MIIFMLDDARIDACVSLFVFHEIFILVSDFDICCALQCHSYFRNTEAAFLVSKWLPVFCKICALINTFLNPSLTSSSSFI